MKKFCKKHGDLKIEDIQIEKIKWITKEGEEKRGEQYRCRLCRREKDIKYKHDHREERLIYNKKWRKENREWVNERERLNRKKYPEKYKKWAAMQREKLGKLKSVRESCYKFKIEIDDYNKMFEEQKGLCKICNQEETRKSGKGNEISRLAIDHCHKTGRVRGLLCHSCNVGLGSFKDSKELLMLAWFYLD